MPNWINSAREFLGLGQDPYYDDDEYHDEPYADDEVDDEPRARPVRPAPPMPGRPVEADWEDGDGGVRMIGTTPEERPAAGPAITRSGSDRGVVRPLPTATKPEVVSPTRFEDVQTVADAFKKVQPVIVNLQGVDRDLSRRLIDFASGLCYGLEGEMERVAEQVFLLTPKGAEVSDDDRRRLEEGRVAEYDR